MVHGVSIKLLLSRTTLICNTLICKHFWWYRSVVWKKMRKKSVASHVMKRDNVFYYVRHVPKDLIDHYSVKRLCFSLKTKCESSANRSSRSITQRLNDYWYGVRFSKMDVPVNNLIASKQNNKTLPTNTNRSDLDAMISSRNHCMRHGLCKCKWIMINELFWMTPGSNVKLVDLETSIIFQNQWS